MPVQKAFEFKFHTVKLVDDQGKETGETRKYEPVKAELPVPSVEELVAYLNRGPEDRVAKYILRTIYADIQDTAKSQIVSAHDETPEELKFDPTKFDLEALSIEKIAAQERKSRAGYQPTKEELDEFIKDYASTLADKCGLDKKKVSNHGPLLKRGFASIKGDKNLLQRFKDTLALYAAHTENMEEHDEVYGWELEHLDMYMKKEVKPTEERLF